MLNIDISNIDYENLKEFIDKNISDFKNFELSIRFKSDYSQSRMIRSTILYIFDKNNINMPWRGRFSLISDELVNNSIEYGSQAFEENLFIMKFSSSDNFLNINIEVHDTGKGLLAKNSIEMESVRKTKEENGFDGYLGKRGRGLFQLVKNIVDDLYFKDNEAGGLIVGVNKKLELI
ncbi:MAG: ATP-binding protein [Candidatus Gracilibacteria bacterium]|nr:ATP-binding protein [Candidatus Gracilibacteria bacterium]